MRALGIQSNGSRGVRLYDLSVACRGGSCGEGYRDEKACRLRQHPAGHGLGLSPGGKVERADEVVAIFKTGASLADDVRNNIRANCPPSR
jgi:hypothetical protein